MHMQTNPYIQKQINLIYLDIYIHVYETKVDTKGRQSSNETATACVWPVRRAVVKVCVAEPDRGVPSVGVVL